MAALELASFWPSAWPCPARFRAVGRKNANPDQPTTCSVSAGLFRARKIPGNNSAGEGRMDPTPLHHKGLRAAREPWSSTVDAGYTPGCAAPLGSGRAYFLAAEVS